ncbi:hypothetical protein CTAYLR_010406 [Chrysophaeum taylorii]|uniref:Cyanate lyase C-terminal domain-containing protein n=1 Tax=Chrysophaeum taylorii TaxID=2483200 RepID=A0AAD7UHN7_9STRA|nr:hypothetical protein CTAYLR_010406 [Chrysophaeum taylorii]
MFVTRQGVVFARHGLRVGPRSFSSGLADRVLAAKQASGKTFDELAASLGYTNAYTAQLLMGQAQLKPGARDKLAALLPTITAEDLDAMMAPPFRTFDSDVLKEPNVYRTYEAITHYGHAIKALVNEKFGDGIMSAIDFYLTVGETTGKSGERRVVVTFNGKFLPFIEQLASDNSAPAPDK